MQVKCEFCGSIIEDSDKFCGYCGAINENYGRNDDLVPEMIAELQSW